MSHGAGRGGAEGNAFGRDRDDSEEDAAPRTAVARGIGLVLGTKPNSAKMR